MPFTRFIRPRDVAISLLLGVLTVLCWPVVPWRVDVPVNITITALGTSNPSSQSTEVWISALPSDMKRSALRTKAKPKNSWELREGSLVSYRYQPARITWNGALPQDAEFVFARHGWSGQVAVEINGLKRTYDLFASGPSGSQIVNISEFPVEPRTNWRNSWNFLSLVLIFSSVILAIISLLHYKPNRSVSYEPVFGFWRALAIYSLPSFIVFTLVLLGTWPAQMSPDSISQWTDLHLGAFSNAHPVVHTFLIGGPGYLLGSPGWSMAIQIVLMALAIGGTCVELRRWSVPRWLVGGAALLVPLFAPVHLMATTFWKDVPFTIAVVVLATLLLVLLRTGGAAAARRSFLVAFLLVLFLVATLRHNGLIVAAGTILALFILYRRILRRRLIVGALFAGLLIPIALNAAILPALGVKGIGKHYGGIIPMHLLGSFAAEGKITDGETLRHMQTILPLEQWQKAYDCQSVVPLFWEPGISWDQLDASLMKPAIREILRNPGVALKHLVCVNSLNWRISPPVHAARHLVPLDIWQDPSPGAIQITYNPVSQLVANFLTREVSWTTSNELLFSIFWRPASVVFIILILVSALRQRQKLCVVFVVLSPVLFNTLSLVPLIGSQDYRYQFPLVLAGLLLTPLLIHFARQTICESSTQLSWSPTDLAVPPRAHAG
ncbi:DUF6020 family protein [Microvirga soli]|uniref:DUF6020 family protein n=1 Tax=Microvirga soli TaxID=1854496 RepID=UPI00191CC848|nr:DUF6020 family protein [Microvirga soli]